MHKPKPYFQVPFREAHGLSGAAVHVAESKGCPLNELTLEDLKKVRWAVRSLAKSLNSPYFVLNIYCNEVLRILFCTLK